MAEPLKNSYGPDIPGGIARDIAAIHPAFDRGGFVTACLVGWEDLELTPRARQVSDQLAVFLPADRAEAMQILTRSLGDELDSAELEGMEGFRFLPHVYFAADHGDGHFEEAMTLQYEVTKRFTAEFSLRTFIESDYEATMTRLHEWVTDENVHVRRLVSEGTRSRLPWAARIKRFQEDPTPVIELLEFLKDDPEEYVRRSVANNLNDIAKDRPELVVATARDWWPATVTTEAERHRRRLIKHGLRSLIKAGDPGALDVIGYGADSPATIDAVRVLPTEVEIGGKVRIEVDVKNPSKKAIGALVDLRIQFVKANGSTAPKVFKGAELEIDAGATATFGKNVSLKQHSTRTHYPGRHEVEILLNGTAHEGGVFQLRP